MHRYGRSKMSIFFSGGGAGGTTQSMRKGFEIYLLEQGQFYYLDPNLCLKAVDAYRLRCRAEADRKNRPETGAGAAGQGGIFEFAQFKRHCLKT